MFLLQSSGASGYGMTQLFFMLAVFAVLYFFFLRPQVKKQREQEKFVTDIKTGSIVVTGSGIIGKISKIEKNHVTIITDNKTYLQMVHSAISKELTEQYVKAKNKQES